MTHDPRAGADAARRGRTRRASGLRHELVLPWWGAVLAAAVGGVLQALAFPAPGVWVLSFPAIALVVLAARGRRLGAAFGVGALYGAVFYVIHIWWITVYLGAPPLLALVGLEAIWHGVGGIALTLVWRWLDPLAVGRTPAAAWVRFLGIPAALALVWAAREHALATWPWGGFSWGRLAYAQSESPIGDAVSWVGVTGLGFLMVLTVGVVLQALIARRTIARRRLVIAVAAAIGLVAIPLYPSTPHGTLTVGAVQGDTHVGLFAPYEYGATIAQHAETTELLAGDDIDLLVWPENSGEFYLDKDPVLQAAVQAVVDEVDAPLVIGTIIDDDGDLYNSLLLFEPGAGVVADYHKRHPVPFAEYLPWRDFFYPLAPDLFDLIPRDYSIDPTSANAFEIDGIVAGLAICFDIVDDGLTREMVLDHGAEIILAPTNNADFGEGSWENVQQLQIAQIRAMESGRALIQISTVGTSAMMLPDGTIISRLPQYQPGAMLDTLPLSSTVTPAIRFGVWIDGLIVLGAPLLLLGLGILVRRQRA